MRHKYTTNEASRFRWGKVTGLNYKLLELQPPKSILYARLEEDHGSVETGECDRIYYILRGYGEFEISNKKIPVRKGDVVVVPPKTKYDYRPTSKVLEVLLFMEYWDSTKWEI